MSDDWKNRTYDPPKHYHDIRFRRMHDITDWYGRVLLKKILRLLKPGCFVRCIVTLYDLEGQEVSTSAEYFEITKIKDKSIWGTALGMYRVDCGDNHYYPTTTGRTYTFKFKNISEIPISWHSKDLQKKMKIYRTDKGYMITGYR